MTLSEQEGNIDGEAVNASVRTFIDISLPGK
jgi:hypothetical protein